MQMAKIGRAVITTLALSASSVGSLPAQAPTAVALLRLDTDWYLSTKHEMEHLYPRLSAGGVLIVDDYGHWDGARQAVEEYFLTHGDKPLLARTDYTGRLAVKG